MQALSKLHHRETQDKLQAFLERQSGSSSSTPLVVTHSSQLSQILSNRDPSFWCSGFVRLFPRGDCTEKCSERQEHLVAWRWAKTLLTRADSSLWRQDVEFMASVFNVFLRRDQVGAVEATMRSAAFSVQQKEDMEKLSATNLVANLLASGEVSSIRSALRKKGLDKPIETAFRKMQIIQRNVRGSEAEKDNLLPKFSAMRLWSGCSSLFFTLNPHDIRSPLTILLLQNDVKFEKTFSLDLSDEATAEFMTSFLRENPRL